MGNRAEETSRRRDALKNALPAMVRKPNHFMTLVLRISFNALVNNHV